MYLLPLDFTQPNALSSTRIFPTIRRERTAFRQSCRTQSTSGSLVPPSTRTLRGYFHLLHGHCLQTFKPTINTPYRIYAPITICFSVHATLCLCTFYLTKLSQEITRHSSGYLDSSAIGSGAMCWSEFWAVVDPELMSP